MFKYDIFILFFFLGFVLDQFNFNDLIVGNFVFFKLDKYQVFCYIIFIDVLEKRIGCEIE